ncbi:PREDICTED: uncharacterized protein LOC109585391 [Amphimedon queenslandica]|uniref:Fibronectin type-III domain-containing protein n=1 Tax=Amphimedon queenslandica TaxID=400682 RepID=A0AAN0JJQ2_AMPQE|nr:PREDICTED: uncharacterized protein LOC109585391 [Amphimedon queenslandica]|eukprot:XP_019857016.1 PREDICTED: uncharacterized protein LOC109585391 [Amphimedon queenslandica]
MKSKSVLFYILISLCFLKCELAVITLPLEPATAHIDTEAIFTCEGTGDILNWLVESVSLTDSIKQQREVTVTTTNIGNTDFSSVLTVKAIPINDGLGIGCEVISYNLSNPFNPFNRVVSGSALTIRGISSVENLNINFTSNASLITWSPPLYFSNDIPHGSPVSYQVLVTDDERDIILDQTTPNTNITVPNVSECDTFNVSVTAILDQYTSIDDANKTNGSFSIAEYDAQPLIPSISFELGCPPSRSLVSLMDGNTEVTDIINETDHIIRFKLSPFRRYELTAVVENLRGKTRATYNTSICKIIIIMNY